MWEFMWGISERKVRDFWDSSHREPPFCKGFSEENVRDSNYYMIAPRSQLDRQRAVSNPYRRILLPPIENTAYPTDMSAQRVGTNRSYLSQYFSRQGITYNTYINNLRIKHFISCYEESIAAGQTVSAQQLAYESGFRSYRTFSRAFMQRTGQSVTTWKCDTGGYLAKRNNF